jgi:hypothetical protein
VRAIAEGLGLGIVEALPTTEAIFTSLALPARRRLGRCVAEAIRQAVETRFAGVEIAVWLTDMSGEQLGTAGGLSPWRR